MVTYYRQCKTRLKTIDINDFSELFRRKVVRFSDNPITSIVGLSSISGKMQMTNLEELHLDKNKLVSLKKDSFYNLTSLKILNLSFNSICIVDLNTFAYFNRTTYLNLSNNSITQ